MRKKLILSIFLAAAIVTGITGIAIIAADSPGSANDPLVSKSYVDEKFDRLNEIIPNLQPAPAEAYIPVFAVAGEIILGGEGTEIILRSGEAVSYGCAENGLVNATSGSELFNNAEILKNNIIIVPRNDGRGVRASTDAWFIIKGSYEEIKPYTSLEGE